MSEKEERKIVIPGEIIVKGDDYLPGEGTIKSGEGIMALRYGLAEESNKLIKVIPLSGVYNPRRGNVVLGRVENIVHSGWIIDLGFSEKAFLNVSEVPKYVNQNDLESVMNIGDMLTAKISNLGKRGVDLTIKSRGLGRIEEGLIVVVNPNKVPRIIGKEGSMINLIKQETGCNITVGQNGIISIRGETVDEELKAKAAIQFVSDNSIVQGLTDKLNEWFKENGGKK